MTALVFIGIAIFVATVIIILSLKTIHQTIMENQEATNEQFNTLMTELSAATTAVGARLETIVEQLKNGGLTKEQETALYSRISAEVVKLKAMGENPENPIPAEEEGEDESGDTSGSTEDQA